MMLKQMQNLWQCQNHMVGDINTEQFQGYVILLVYIFNSRFVWVQYNIDKDSSYCSLSVSVINCLMLYWLFNTDACLKLQG